VIEAADEYRLNNAKYTGAAFVFFLIVKTK
jgi:hypothetical protein